MYRVHRSGGSRTCMSLSATHQPLMLTIPAPGRFAAGSFGLRSLLAESPGSLHARSPNHPRSVFPTAWRVQPPDARIKVVANLAGLAERFRGTAPTRRCSRVAQARVCKTLDAGSIPATASKQCNGFRVPPQGAGEPIANILQT